MSDLFMNPEVARIWVDALRSDNYTQCSNCLREKDAYCCLGVLCDISKLGEWEEEHYLGSWAMLPSEVQSWSGLNAGATSTLANLNDTCRYDFDQIANYIEKEMGEHMPPAKEAVQ